MTTLLVRLLSAIALLAASACAPPAQDGPWTPSRPVEFIVAAGPGGGSDQLARTVQAIVQKHNLMDASIIVTNKGGGAGSEAFVYAKGAAGDPHKVVFGTNNVWLLPLGTAVGYTVTDLRPVAAMALDEFVLWVNAKSPYRDVGGFLGAARGPARLTMAGTQAKDTDQVLVRQIEKTAGVSFTYVPFKSGSEVAVQLAGGHVAGNVNNPQENIAQWRAGTVRPLCVFSPERLAYTDAVTADQSWADVPTCLEAGLPIERYQMPRTVWLPGGVTDEPVAFYRDVLAKVRETEEWKTWLRRGSQTDAFMTGEALADYIAADERRLREQFEQDGWLVK
jgi:tripartite-type tricarboxylate transporter receptor subunit TctC